jgi:hypothetical protein
MVKRRRKTVKTTETFFISKRQGEEQGKCQRATENYWPLECTNIRIIMPCYLCALHSVHLCTMQTLLGGASMVNGRVFTANYSSQKLSYVVQSLVFMEAHQL